MLRLYTLFILSGAAGLVLETVLLRQFAWSCGSSAAATALVLAAFMAGLAIGSASLGTVADRSSRPLRIYGLLEIGVGLSGAALVWLLGSGRELFLAPLRSLPNGTPQLAAEFALAFALVLLPTWLMGGTLPAVSRFAIREMSGMAKSLGLLYGLNTLGAAAGVFVAGFYLIEILGVSRTAYLAALFNILVGIGALLLDRASPVMDPRPAVKRKGPAESPEPESDAAVRAACLFAACIGGFAVLGYEVAWTRLLSLLLRSFTYSFALMLSLFLLGLVLGALVLSLAGRHIRRPAEALGWIEVAIGVYVATSLLWLPGNLTPAAASSFPGFLARSSLRAAPVVLPPTILSGMALPLAVRCFSGGARRVGRDVGAVFAVNTAGGILGALAAGLLLLPTAGGPLSLALLASLSCTAGLVVLLAVRSGWYRLFLAGSLAAACAFSATAAPERFTRAFLAASSGSGSIGELLFFRESATDTVAIVRKEYGFRDHTAKSLITNGFAMAATVKPVRRYMAAEGHLPVLLAPPRPRAMVIGVGTGITLGAVASHPGVQSITAVELSEGVLEGLKYFAEENETAYEDPRLLLIRQDGRHFLELAADEYDLITLEPPPPIVAGSVHLYALDFYLLCREHLLPGGAVAQWLPLHAQSLLSARMTAKTFLEAFPYVQLWLPSARDAVLIGMMEPPELPLDRLLDAYDEPNTKRNLTKAYLESPEALLATYLMDRRGIERWAGDAPVVTDERPLMEFFRHHGGNMNDRDIATLLEWPQAGWNWIRGLDRRPDLLDRVIAENEALRLYLDSVVRGNPESALQAAMRSHGTEFFLHRLGCAAEQLAQLRRSVKTPAAAAHLDRCASLKVREGG